MPVPKQKVVSDYVVAHAAVSRATTKANELIQQGYFPWGSPCIESRGETREPLWVQVFIIKEEKE